mmetsp:Transcript_19129/g.60004  ORF Transcript_19129/g.60004 Transcript_19129/m.60004 type:complete len:275 (+) Transcript_19129:317-1141(+)
MVHLLLGLLHAVHHFEVAVAYELVGYGHGWRGWSEVVPHGQAEKPAVVCHRHDVPGDGPALARLRVVRVELERGHEGEAERREAVDRDVELPVPRPVLGLRLEEVGDVGEVHAHHELDEGSGVQVRVVPGRYHEDQAADSPGGHAQAVRAVGPDAPFVHLASEVLPQQVQLHVAVEEDDDHGKHGGRHPLRRRLVPADAEVRVAHGVVEPVVQDGVAVQGEREHPGHNQRHDKHLSAGGSVVLWIHHIEPGPAVELVYGQPEHGCPQVGRRLRS